MNAPSKRMQSVVVWALVLLAAVVTVGAGALLRGRSYVLVSTLLVVYGMVPVFFSFERRRPQAREVVTIAVMCALAVAARAAFVWLPNFKPMAAIVMITGVGLGAPAGFLTGALAALVSNFIFGQGPWTPWQMLAFGLCGAVFGFLGQRGIIPASGLSRRARALWGAGGAAFVVLVAGPILDTSSLFFMLSRLSWEGAVAVYAAGFPVNCLQGAATFITIFVLADPLLGQLVRLRTKYGSVR